MSWKNIRLIFTRELFEQLRDRRTLFVIVAVPVMLYLMLGVGATQIALLFVERPRTVVVLGAEHLPSPPLLDGDQFADTWFNRPADARKLRVFTDLVPPSGEHNTSQPRGYKLIQAARAIQQKVAERADMRRALEQADELSHLRREPLERESDRVSKELNSLFSESNIQVIMIVPEGFRSDIERVQSQIEQWRIVDEQAVNYAKPTLIRNSADENSLIAFARVKSAVTKWEQAILSRWLAAADMPDALLRPVDPDSVELADIQDVAANLWSKLLPALLVMIVAVGAFYPAVDVCAGERERGTMETLLVCPAARSEIVIGKFLFVMLFCVVASGFSLAGIGFTGQSALSLAMGDENLDAFTAPPITSLLWVAVLLLPLAALFSAVSMALATFARSTKEGQYYLAPLLGLSMALAGCSLMPSMEITPFYSLLPIVGPTLWLKALLSSQSQDVTVFAFAVPVLASSAGYCALALYWAVIQFGREEVLFRDSDRFDLRSWIRGLAARQAPTFGRAILCFFAIMILQFHGMKFLLPLVSSEGGAEAGTSTLRLMILQQILFVAGPCVLMGFTLSRHPRRVFRFRLPGWRPLAAAGCLAFFLHPLIAELSVQLQWFFPPLPESIRAILHAASGSEHSTWLVVLAFAATPAICEELAFRGYLLSGFNNSGRTGLAIVISSLAFGAMHMVPQQVFIAILLGLVLGVITVRSNSILPAITFHFLFNSIEILKGRLLTVELPNGVVGLFFYVEGEQIRYSLLALTVAAAGAALLLRPLLLNRHGNLFGRVEMLEWQVE